MTTAVPIKHHAWVKWSLQPVDVIVDPFTGLCSAVESPNDPIGEQVCCHHCGEPLTESLIGTACSESLDSESP